MADLTHIKVGDVLVCRDANEGRMYSNGPPTRTVTKVGRKYLYVKHDRVAYDRTTGRGNDSCNHAWVQTVEDHAAERRWEELEARLRRFGLSFDYSCRADQALRVRIAETVLGMIDQGA